MTVARNQLVDPEVTRYYHCISRCVRGAQLCGGVYQHRKQWIEDRLQLLAENFAISVAGFAVMDNHLHVLVRLDGQLAEDWSDEETLRRWLQVYHPRTMDLDDDSSVAAWVACQAPDAQKVQVFRDRLCSLGWFMKALKEPLARLANQEDDCRGSFWEGRYKSIAILDEEALLATCAYIDLNPFAAGVSALPETSRHTSLRQRVAHVRSQGKLDRLQAARQGSAAGCQAAGDLEQDHWLLPIEDRRGRSQGALREGLLDSFSLGSYLQLVDYTSRLYRQGKARLSWSVQEIFQRLGTSHHTWWSRLEKMLSSRALYGSYFTVDRSRLTQLAHRRGLHHLANLSPQLSS